MKKTATREIYTPHGTTNTRAVDVRYRGRTLFSFLGHRDQVGEMLQKAITFCQNQGFSGTKTAWLA
jgi:hypothetical protein